MWGLMKYGQSWSELTEKYNEIIEEYKKFGLDLIDIKKDLEFYLSIIPVVFLTGAIVHLYFFRKAHTKIAKL
jgi:hypothetical protein